MLSRGQKPAEGNLAILLLLKVFGDVHAHAQLLVALADLAYEFHATTRYQLPERGSSYAVARTKVRLDLEIQRLLEHFGLHLGCKVEYVLDDINLALCLLIKVDEHVDSDVA